jgi:hypothetical protein
MKQAAAILPRQPEGAHVRDAKPGHDIAHPIRLELTIHHLSLRPVNKLFQRQFVLKVRGDFLRYFLAGDGHDLILRRVMSLIDRELPVDFNQCFRIIVNFLPETNGRFTVIDFLDIPRSPSVMTSDIKPIASPAVRQVFPLVELPLISFAVGHDPSAHALPATVARRNHESRSAM